MLRIAKLRVGAEAYHLSGVARGLDDYYTGRGEAPGVWQGQGAARLGLGGEVAPEDLRAVLAGLAPGTGGRTPNGETLKPRGVRVPGFDLTFKAPKSASVLYAVSDDPGVQAAVIEAGEAALAVTLRWLEERAVRVQRGSHNRGWLERVRARDPQAADRLGPRTEATSGMVAAVFRHRTSREGDPLLHWHCLVANLAEGRDGRWSALAHPELYRAARAAGERFQTVFRAELTARLGVEWRPGRHVPEIAGIPQQLLDVFSKRRAQIESWLEATGGPRDAAGQERAALATRRGKTEREGERFDAAWKAEAALTAGWGPPEAARLLAEPHDGVVPGYDRAWRLPEEWVDDTGQVQRWDRLVDPEEWIADLARRDLTVERSTFGVYEVTQAVAARLGDGASTATVDRVVDRVLASPHLVAVHNPGDPSGDAGRWSSRELIDVETRFLTAVEGPAGKRGPVPEHVINTVVAAQRSIGGDQADAVVRLCGSDRVVRVLVGPAGTGKTYTLDVVRQAFEADGRWLVGAAPSAKAALELDGAGIESATIQRRLAQLATHELVLDAAAVVVVDEAGMAGIRDLERLVSAAVAAGATVVLAGDHRQLPEITAGGGFAAAVTAAGPRVGELVTNRRQQARWEQQALAELREGNVATAVDAYRHHDRVVVAGSRHELIGGAVDAWFAARAAGQRAVLVTGTIEMCSAVNAVVRDRLVAGGELPAPNLAYGGRTFAVGERVVLRRNSRYELDPAGARLAVVNGEAGTVIGGGNGELHVALDRAGRVVHLGAGYLERGEVDHGYAITTHRAQGGTWDVTIGVGLDGLYREAAYTLLSRGRAGNWLHVTGRELDRVDAELDRHDTGLPLPGELPEVDEELRGRLGRSGAKQLALAADPDAAAVHRLAHQHTHADLLARAVHCRQAERTIAEQIGVDVDQLARVWARCQHTARHISVGCRVKAYDRRNLGTVEAIDDRLLHAQVRFDGDRGTAVRTLDLGILEVLQPPIPRPLSDTAFAALYRRGERIDEILAEQERQLGELGIQPGEAGRCEWAAGVQVDQEAARLRAQRPDWLAAVLGARPHDLIGRQLWDDSVLAVARWRTARALAVDNDGLGARPELPDDADQWGALHAQLATSRAWLSSRDQDPAAIVVGQRTRAELQARLIELQDVYATAPLDHQQLVTRLSSGDPTLPLQELADALTAASTAQNQRRQWILTHWPEVVEGNEIRRALDGAAGPDLYDLFTQLDRLAPHGRGTDDWTADPPAWACRLLARLAGAEGRLHTDHLRLVDDVHAYRHNHCIKAADPLGPEPVHPHQASHRAQLLARVQALTPPPTPTRADPLVREESAAPRLDLGR